MTKKYCLFSQSVYDQELKVQVWDKAASYLITYEDDEYYYFGEPVANGISKVHEGILFTIEIREAELV